MMLYPAANIVKITLSTKKNEKNYTFPMTFQSKIDTFPMVFESKTTFFQYVHSICVLTKFIEIDDVANKNSGSSFGGLVFLFYFPANALKKRKEKKEKSFGTPLFRAIPLL